VYDKFYSAGVFDILEGINILTKDNIDWLPLALRERCPLLRDFCAYYLCRVKQKRLKAIIYLRESTSLSVVDAKDYLDTLCGHKPIPYRL